MTFLALIYDILTDKTEDVKLMPNFIHRIGDKCNTNLYTGVPVIQIKTMLLFCNK